MVTESLFSQVNGRLTKCQLFAGKRVVVIKTYYAMAPGVIYSHQTKAD